MYHYKKVHLRFLLEAEMMYTRAGHNGVPEYFVSESSIMLRDESSIQVSLQVPHKYHYITSTTSSTMSNSMNDAQSSNMYLYTTTKKIMSVLHHTKYYLTFFRPYLFHFTTLWVGSFTTSQKCQFH